MIAEAKKMRTVFYKVVTSIYACACVCVHLRVCALACVCMFVCVPMAVTTVNVKYVNYVQTSAA